MAKYCIKRIEELYDPYRAVVSHSRMVELIEDRIKQLNGEMLDFVVWIGPFTKCPSKGETDFNCVEGMKALRQYFISKKDSQTSSDCSHEDD